MIFYILKLFDELNLFLTKIGCIFKSPKLCSFSWKLSIIRHNLKVHKKKKNILVLYKSIGILDLDLLKKKNSKKISVFILPRAQIKVIFHSFFKNLDHSINDNNYITKNAIIEKRKILYRFFLIKILNDLNKSYKFRSIVSFNYRYYAERELHKAAKQCNIKFVCIHKESLIFPGEIKYYKEVVKNSGKFEGDLMLVYNNLFRKIIASCPNIETKKVNVIGMPRADYYYKLKKKEKNFFLILLINPDRNILFFNLHKKLKKKFKEIQWDNLSYLTIKNTLNFAKSNPNTDFFFKSKRVSVENLNDKKYSQEKLILDSKLRNCKLILGGDTRELIKDAKAIIGFNSTALIEGLILKKPVIVPCFGIKKKSIMKNFMLNLSNSVFNAKNKKIFNLLMEKILKNNLKEKKISKKKLNQIIYNHIGNIDGKSTKRLENYLL